MRDRTYVSTHVTADVTVEQIVREKVGRDIAELFPKAPAEIGQPVLSVRGRSRDGVFRDISFEERARGDRGTAGLVGAGRTEVARAIFGIDPYDSGEISFDHRPLKGGIPRQRSTPAWGSFRKAGASRDWS